MQENIAARLEELTKEYETGRARLAELEATANDLRQTMLRIEGAMLALRELTEGDPAADGDSALSALNGDAPVVVGADA
jgi:hypothetical protein